MVEILVAAGIFVTAVSVFLVSFGFLDDLSRHAADRTQAALLLEEGAEAVLLLRDLGWEDNVAALAEATPYSLYWDGAEYRVAEGEVAIGSYLRQITFFPAYRDGTDSYSDSGTLDPDTKRVLIEILRLSDDKVLGSAEMLVHNAYE